MAVVAGKISDDVYERSHFLPHLSPIRLSPYPVNCLFWSRCGRKDAPRDAKVWQSFSGTLNELILELT
jgi:hypothetical protein